MISDTNITVQVSSLDNSITFYELLGFDVKQRWKNYYAQMTCPGMTLGLHPTESVHIKSDSGNVSIGLLSMISKIQKMCL